MKVKIPDCNCGGQAVLYDKGDIAVIKCSECSQFVTEASKEMCIQEWKVRISGQKQKNN
mgnify:CR=1 FL=1